MQVKIHCIHSKSDINSVQFNSVQMLSCVWLFATSWTAACQASLSTTISRSSLRLTSIESVMPSSHLILGRPLFLLPPIPPSIRVFSNESTLRMRWPKYWTFSFSIIPSKEIPGLISFRMDWLDLLVKYIYNARHSISKIVSSCKNWNSAPSKQQAPINCHSIFFLKWIWWLWDPHKSEIIWYLPFVIDLFQCNIFLMLKTGKKPTKKQNS